MILVVVHATDGERIAEALRAAVGLGLRGDAVHVALSERARSSIDNAGDPRITRALATLPELGQTVSQPSTATLAELCHRADAVEVWT